jgi:tetratricopeptide (TPR) repeat protein
MDLLMWAKVVLLCIGTGVSFLFRKQRPWFLFGIFWFFLVLMPSNSIIARLDVVNERHLYLADFGIFLALGCEAGCLGTLNTGIRTAVAGTAAALLCVLLFFTVNRNNDYRTEVSLWESTVRNSPIKARGYNNLGCAYELAGMPEKAVRAYEIALRLDPFHENARANLVRLNAKEVLKLE